MEENNVATENEKTTIVQFVRFSLSLPFPDMPFIEP